MSSTRHGQNTQYNLDVLDLPLFSVKIVTLGKNVASAWQVHKQDETEIVLVLPSLLTIVSFYDILYLHSLEKGDKTNERLKTMRSILMNNIKWLFFDLGSTLVDESEVYKSRCDYIIKQKGIKYEEFMEKVYEAAKTNPAAIKSAAQYYNVILPEWDNRLEKLYAGTKAVLETLSGKYKLGIIANQLSGTQKRINNWGIGNYFEVMIASAEAGCAKPDLEIFNLALEKAGCEPYEAMMIGDRLDNDIAPAKLLGMKTVWVRQGFAKYQNINNESEQPNYIIDNIADIVNVLEK